MRLTPNNGRKFLALLMLALAAFAIDERASIRRFFVDNFAVQVTTDEPIRAGQEQELNLIKDVVNDRQQFEVENVQPEAQPPIIALPKVSFQTYALYTDVGAGPLPPQVGLPTLYRIFLNVSDPSRELASLTVTTSLPKGVLWAGNASARAGAAPAFDERTRRIQWVASDPANQDALEASFDVQLTPNANHIGAILPLLNEAELIYAVSGGKGSFTKASSGVTTELSNDPGARGLGSVVP